MLDSQEICGKGETGGYVDIYVRTQHAYVLQRTCVRTHVRTYARMLRTSLILRT